MIKIKELKYIKSRIKISIHIFFQTNKNINIILTKQRNTIINHKKKKNQKSQFLP